MTRSELEQVARDLRDQRNTAGVYDRCRIHMELQRIERLIVQIIMENKK